MRETTDHDHEAGDEPPAEGGNPLPSEPEAAAPQRTKRTMADYDFENPDEETLQFVEEQWLRFCRAVGLEGEVPDIRPVFLSRERPHPRVRRRVRQFVREWIAEHRPDLLRDRD